MSKHVGARMASAVMWVVLGVAAVVLPASAALAEAPCLIRPLVTAAQCDEAPIIDGKLDDAAWRRAGGSRFAVRPGDLENRMRICWDSQMLYVSVWCREPNMATMRAEGEDHAQFADQEYVELFLAPKDLSGTYHHFVVTAANQRKAEHGSVDCNDRFYKPWSGHWQSAVFRGPDHWQAEIAIRLADVATTLQMDDRWGMTLVRNRKNEDTTYADRYWWSPLVGEPDVKTGNEHAVYFPEMLGLLRFVDRGTAAVDGVGDLFPGSKQAELAAFDLDDAEVVVRAGSRLYQGEQTWQLGDVSNAVKVRTRQKIASDVPTSIRWAQLAGEEVVSVEVVNRADGQVVYASGQLYRRPVTRDRIWEEIAGAQRPEAAMRELKAVVAAAEESDAPYKQRLAMWEDARSQLRARLVGGRHEQLMRNGPKENGQGAYGIGIASSLTNIRPKALTLGRLDYTSTVSLQAARNEMESAQVILYSPHKDLRDVTLTCSDLRGQSGASIASQAIWAAPMGFVKTEQPGQYEVSYVGWWSDPILTYLDKFDVVRSDLQPVWYSVRVPMDAAPGMYRGTLTITPANAPKIELPVNLEVWDFALPQTPSLNTILNDHLVPVYQHENPSTERMDALQEASDRFLMAHRCNSGDYARTIPPKESEIARYAEIGVRCFSILNFRAYEWPGVEGPAWAKKSKRDPKEIHRFISDTLATAKKYGIEDRAFIYMPDEAGSHLFPVLEEMSRWLKQEFPGLTLVTTERLSGYIAREAAEGLPFGSLSGRTTVDWLVVTTSGFNKDWADYARKAGCQVWWYTATGPYKPYANLFLDYPAVDARLLMGFMAYAYGPDGFLHWGVMDETNNEKKLTGGPYTDWNPQNRSGHNGAGNLVYPGQNGPITGIRMENWLDGMEDYEYCVLAEKRIQELRDAGRNAEADRLNSVLAPYADPGNEVVKSLTQYTLDPTVVEAARRKVAALILEAR